MTNGRASHLLAVLTLGTSAMASAALGGCQYIIGLEPATLWVPDGGGGAPTTACKTVADCTATGTCASPVCVDGRCGSTVAAPGFPCTDPADAAGVCDDSGQCVGCTTSADCTASHPDRPICDASSRTCVSCADGDKNGDETDIDCGGKDCGGCTGGHACNMFADCAATYPACVDGACCESTCKAQCSGCDAAGLCSDLPAGHPDPTCNPTQACGPNGAGCLGRAGAVCVSGLDCLSGTCAGSGTSKTCAKSGPNGACTDGTDCVSANCQNYICE